MGQPLLACCPCPSTPALTTALQLLGTSVGTWHTSACTLSPGLGGTALAQDRSHHAEHRAVQKSPPDRLAWFFCSSLLSLLQFMYCFTSQVYLQRYTSQDKFAPKVITFQLPSSFLAQHKNSTAPLEGAAEYFSPGCTFIILRII